MEAIRKAKSMLTKIIIVVSSVCLLVSIIITFINTIGRYGFGFSFEWAEELVRYLIILISFLVSAPMITEGAHISMTLLPDNIKNEKFQWFYRLFCYITTLIAAVLLFVWSIELVQSTPENMRSYSLVFNMRMIYAIMPCTMIFNILFSIFGIVESFLTVKTASQKKGNEAA